MSDKLISSFVRSCESVLSPSQRQLRSNSEWTRMVLSSGRLVPKTNGYSMGDETGYCSSTGSEVKLLETENENLKTQLGILQAQIRESQNKVKDAEQRLSSSNDKLMKAEERLHKEQLNKTFLESHKLDLMSEVAELRARLQTVEVERSEYREKCDHLQSQLLDVHETLMKRDREIAELKSKLGKNGFHNGEHLTAESEMETLKKALNNLMVCNEEKDRKIDELRKAVSTYQKVEEIILQSHISRPRSDDGDSTNSTPAERTVRANSHSVPKNHKQNGLPAATSTPVTDAGLLMVNGNTMNQFSTIAGTPTPKRTLSVQRSSSFDGSKFNRIIANDKMASTRHDSSSSLPKDCGNHLNRPIADAQKDVVDHYEAEFTTDDEEPGKDPSRKRRGLKRFFSRLKRSSSQEGFEPDQPGAGFKRGGVRATAGPRLGGWTREAKQKSEDFRTPFAQWDSDQVSTWLHEMGLSSYVSDCRRWCRSGKQMLDTSQQDIDKELKIINPLHRKKLHLALDAVRNGSRKDQLILDLRPDWVSKWLDDIGLPQYKDQFYEARVDGRMLNYLTIDDLLYMKITNALHHASIRRGIEILRQHDFNLAALKRRPSLKHTTENTAFEQLSSSVPLWTNHRVMDWLRTIDLSEYAANLRGSGVHGALIMLEPRFTVEQLAGLLNIPASKTLLRRHLLAHFVNLIGPEAQSLKKETEQNPALALSLNTKVKSKKSILFKKGRSQTEYVCPMTGIELIDLKTEDKRVKDAVASYKKELNKRDTNKKDSKLPLKPISDYGQFAQELKQLAGLLETEGS